MTQHQLNSRLTNALRGYLAGEFKVVLTIAAILFVANLAYSAYSVGFAHGQAFEIGRNYTVSGDHSFMIRLRLATSLGLFVCVAGLSLRSLYGVFTSMLAIISLVLVYGWWRRVSGAFLRNLEVPDFNSLPDISHAAGLWGATWWDLIVLAIAATLFVWQAVILIRILKAPDDSFSSDVRTS
jgi:hypothetical protein